MEEVKQTQQATPQEVNSSVQGQDTTTNTQQVEVQQPQESQQSRAVQENNNVSQPSNETQESNMQQNTSVDELQKLKAEVELMKKTLELDKFFESEDGRMFAQYKDEIREFVLKNEAARHMDLKQVAMAVAGDRVLADIQSALGKSMGSDATTPSIKPEKDIMQMSKEEFNKYWQELISISPLDVLK